MKKCGDYNIEDITKEIEYSVHLKQVNTHFIVQSFNKNHCFSMNKIILRVALWSVDDPILILYRDLTKKSQERGEDLT